MNDNTPYARLTTKEKVARNVIESFAIVFELGGKMSAANRLGYTDAWLKRRLEDKTVRGSELLVSMLRGLREQPKVL